uniref:Dolichyl-diphosphooligosaccharide--protein glycosyltransferase subunit 1 n=1 Tax=Aceria tosichella TaxID=561515 RepID=A0A6G1S9T8_9ACAR
MARHLCRCTLLIAFLFTLLRCSSINALVNSKIDRIIDLSTQLVKITERIYIEEENVGTYKIVIEPSHKDRLAYIDATINSQSLDLVHKDDGSYEVDLTGKSPKPLVVTKIFTKLLEPYPREIKQNERQFVRYQGSLTTLSPYPSSTVTTKIKLPQGARLESFTKASKMTTGTNKLTYGPFKDVQPNQAEPLSIHCENNTPFIAVTHLLRTIEVSPWTQSISVVNQVKVVHVGAKLSGPFSRIDYQRDHSNGLSAVRSLNVELPKTASDIFFRDGIGNISTSSVRYTTGKTQVNIKPRFPLFGGWATDFSLGYRVPIKEFLNEPKSGNNYRLSVPLSDVLYDSMFIEDAEVRVTLPAGANNVEIKGAIEIERQNDELNYSYLDVIGRPVVILRKKNVVAQHTEGKPVVIRFDYSKVYMAQEPLLLMAAAIITLILAALYSRLSSKSPNHAGVNKIKED